MHALDGAGTVAVTRTVDGVVHVGGVSRCASVWSCPVCAPTIRERRATEVDTGVAAALAEGLQVVFVTATVQHHLGDYLADVLKLVTKSWSATFSGRGAQDMRDNGYVGQIRNIEVTHGSNGWHPHIHALLFFDQDVNVPSMLHEMGLRFGEAVAGRGGLSMFPGPGWNWSPVASSEAVSAYLAKVDGGWGVGLEMARGDLKLKGKGETPFGLLERAADGDLMGETLFRIYEEGTRGHRFMRWSPGLKERFGVGIVTDEEAAVLELESQPAVCWVIPSGDWNATVAAGQLGALLEAARLCPVNVDLWTGELLASSA